MVAPPGAMGAWGLQMVRDAAVACSPSLEVRLLDRLDTVDLAVASQTIFATQFPSESVQLVVERGQLPIIAFIDDAAEAVAYLLRTTGCTFIDALRSTTCGAVLNPGFFRGVSTLVLHRGLAMGAHRTLERALTHLGLALPADKLAELKMKYCAIGLDSNSLESSLAKCVVGYQPIGRSHDLTAEQHSITEQVLSPLVRMALSDDQPPITWPSGVFLSGDRPNERAPVVAEMTGAARIIYYGPYLYLPAGAWAAEIAVGFSKDAVGSTFTIEVYGSDLIARGKFRAVQTGLFTGTFIFTHKRHQDHLEIRFSNDQGAIEGKFGLAWVKLYSRN